MQKNICLIIIYTKGEHIFSIYYSLVKRGASTEQMVQENYNDIQSERYENGYQKSSIIKIKIVRLTKIKGLQYALAVNQVEFINAGFIHLSQVMVV